MAIPINFHDFFLSGRFGPITLGTTKTAIKALLGPPDTWGGNLPWLPLPELAQAEHSEAPYWTDPIWLYDAIEFHFGTQNELFLIHCDHFEQLRTFGTHFQLDRWLCVDPPLQKVQVQAMLADSQVPYTYHSTSYGGVFRSPLNVELSYDSETDILAAISLYEDRYVRAPQEA